MPIVAGPSAAFGTRLQGPAVKNRRAGLRVTALDLAQQHAQVMVRTGLKMPQIHYSHPLTTSPDLEDRISALSLEHPAWGCNRLSDYLTQEGISVSAPRIQRILNDKGMRTRYDRWLKLEWQRVQQAIRLKAKSGWMARVVLSYSLCLLMMGC